MCDRLSDTYGYICNECFEELVARGTTVDIEEFMTSDKREEQRIDTRGKWESEFQLRE